MGHVQRTPAVHSPPCHTQLFRRYRLRTNREPAWSTPIWFASRAGHARGSGLLAQRDCFHCGHAVVPKGAVLVLVGLATESGIRWCKHGHGTGTGFESVGQGYTVKPRRPAAHAACSWLGHMGIQPMQT
eukprot:199091-Chlamydomonas_euryale.AAC.5